MSRHARVKSRTRIYHIVIKGADRIRLFEECSDYQKYLDILAYYKQECRLEIFAYCLMSNHVHLLLRHPEDISLKSIFLRINTTYALWFNSKYQRTGFLQNDRFHSEPVEDVTYLLTVTKYIHRNPLNAGLEPSIGSSYPWSSYHEYVTESPKLIDSNFILSNFDTIECFQDFHIAAATDSEPSCLDIDKLRRRMPDDVAQELIQKISHCNSSTDFQKLTLIERDRFICELHKKGVSIRQLNRLTGTPRGVIDKILAKNKTL